MNLVIIDDHPFIRASVAQACERVPDVHVAGEAGSGRSAIDLILSLEPDAVSLDLVLDDISGFIVAERVRQRLPKLRILVLSEWLKEYVILRLDAIVVQGFISKRTLHREILENALDALVNNRTFFSIDYLELKQARCKDPLGAARILSTTEQRVLALVGRCMSDEEIGETLGIARTTAQTHRSHLLRKLNLDGTPQLIAYANSSGFSLAADDILCDIVNEKIAEHKLLRRGTEQQS